LTKWCRYATDEGAQVGVLDGEEVRPVFDGTVRLANLSSIVSGHLILSHLIQGEPVSVANVRMLEPLGSYPRNIFCVGKNYREHAAEFAASGYDSSASSTADIVPTHPIIFTKPATSVIGPGDVVESHAALTSELDYEAELAVVIGVGGRGIAMTDAMDHVFGFTIVNDMTARDLQRQHRQWILGKGLDTFCPIGPCVVTADEADLNAMVLECWVNGEIRQKQAVTDLIFDIPTLIATISAGITLLPGDVIATGTPAGVGIGFDPPRFLKTGDEVSITIDSIGTLTNWIG
jgi:2-keto-4-pentenoate hydratase/2-oxohepta-3-ene-1,7-dioic acid hydratase in catechol pathway